MITETIIETDKPKVAPAPARPSGPSKALKLGAKGKEVDNFVDKLKSEGETIMSSNMGKRTSEAAKVHAPPINMESVHMKIEEKITLTCGRDGGLQNMELHGMIMLRISDDKFGRIRLHVENEDKKGCSCRPIQMWIKTFYCRVSHWLEKPREVISSQQRCRGAKVETTNNRGIFYSFDN